MPDRSTTSAKAVFPCPHCGKAFRLSADKAGRTAKCAGCGESFKLKAARPAAKSARSEAPRKAKSTAPQKVKSAPAKSESKDPSGFDFDEFNDAPSPQPTPKKTRRRATRAAAEPAAPATGSLPPAGGRRRASARSKSARRSAKKSSGQPLILWGAAAAGGVVILVVVGVLLLPGGSTEDGSLPGGTQLAMNEGNETPDAAPAPADRTGGGGADAPIGLVEDPVGPTGSPSAPESGGGFVDTALPGLDDDPVAPTGGRPDRPSFLPPAEAPVFPPAPVAPTGPGTWQVTIAISRVFDDGTKNAVRQAVTGAGAKLVSQDWNDSTLVIQFDGVVEDELPKLRAAIEQAGPAVFGAEAESAGG